MGASIATNISTQISKVDTNIQTTTIVDENASNESDQSNFLSGLTISAGGDINITNSTSLINSVQQIGSNSNSANVSNDVALSLAQSATASVSSYGIGIADSYNSAYTMSAITNTVTTTAETNMSMINSASQSNNVTDSTLQAGGTVTIGNT